MAGGRWASRAADPPKVESVPSRLCRFGLFGDLLERFYGLRELAGWHDLDPAADRRADGDELVIVAARLDFGAGGVERPISGIIRIAALDNAHTVKLSVRCAR